MAFAEKRSLLRLDKSINDRQLSENGSSSSDEWSSSYSSSIPNSQHSSEDSLAAEWEAHVTCNGSLFYLEYNLQTIQQTMYGTQNSTDKNQALMLLRSDFRRTSTRRSKKTGNRLSNLINRTHKNHKVPLKNKQSTIKGRSTKKDYSLQTERESVIANKVKFNEMVEGELKEITVFIDPSMRHKFGRRTSVAEALLGVSVCPFPDSTRLMIAGYMPNAEISQDKAIKIGDWLKAINNQDINTENFELILLSFIHPTYIKLQLKRIAVEESPQHQPIFGRATSTVEFVNTLNSLFPSTRIDEHEYISIFNLLFISIKENNDHNIDGTDVIFSYPPKESNCIFSVRGTFLTMNSLFRECTFNSKPHISSVTIQNTEYYISYHCFGNELLLVAIPAKRITIQGAKFQLQTIIKNFELLSQHIRIIFETENNATQADEPNNFSAKDTCSILKFMLLTLSPLYAKLEDSLPEGHYMPLPKEGQLRIDDALSEMEAMDYREWNDEPLKSQREFFILGSVIYFRKYLLASHLAKSELLDIEAFLRTNAIFLLIENRPVRELIIWQEIYPKSMINDNFDLSQNNNSNKSSRWFLTIVARGHLCMAVILESRYLDPEGISSSSTSDYIGPSRFYIEEIQDTLDHLQIDGVENLANMWLNANKRPETLLFKDDPASCAATPVNFNTLNTGVTTSSSTSTVEALAMNLKNTEVISILKRRNNSSENVSDNNLKYTNSMLTTASGGSPSINSQTFSDSSLQKYNEDDEESDSDWDGFPESQRSSSGFDMSEMTSTFFREISDVLFSKVTAGRENVLFHFVQIEMGEGIILAPPNIQSPNMISYSFYRASLLIHSIFQNTMRFRHLLSQETTTSNVHRSLVAIKEHGILISIDKSRCQPFWVIGRLFTNPSKELYVCHRADVPQNLVEIAFRLSLHSAG